MGIVQQPTRRAIPISCSGAVVTYTRLRAAPPEKVWDGDPRLWFVKEGESICSTEGNWRGGVYEEKGTRGVMVNGWNEVEIYCKGEEIEEWLLKYSPSYSKLRIASAPSSKISKTVTSLVICSRS